MCVCVADSPEVTHEGLQHLTSLSRLRVLTLRDLPPYWLTDAKLQGLHGISGLKALRLGDLDSPMQTNFTGADVAGSVRLHTTQAAVCLHPEMDILTQPLWPCRH